jgi:Tat protein secretion system quality control protein TatD with DNase activity
MRPEAVPLLKSVPRERIFFETDGAEIDIRDIYNKVSDGLGVELEVFKKQILKNFEIFFNSNY